MKIACLQFASVKGDVNNNLSRADSVLLKANVDDLDLLVLPELAFSGALPAPVPPQACKGCPYLMLLVIETCSLLL